MHGGGLNSYFKQTWLFDTTKYYSTRKEREKYQNRSSIYSARAAKNNKKKRRERRKEWSKMVEK